MSKIKLGQLNPDTSGSKDCLHMAVVLVKTDAELSAGQKVRFVDNEFNYVRPLKENSGEKAHAIVDPFLPPEVYVDTYKTTLAVLLFPDMTEDLSHQFNIKVADFDIKADDVKDPDEGDWSCKMC